MYIAKRYNQAEKRLCKVNCMDIGVPHVKLDLIFVF